MPLTFLVEQDRKENTAQRSYRSIPVSPAWSAKRKWRPIPASGIGRAGRDSNEPLAGSELDTRVCAIPRTSALHPSESFRTRSGKGSFGATCDAPAAQAERLLLRDQATFADASRSDGLAPRPSAAPRPERLDPFASICTGLLHHLTA